MSYAADPITDFEQRLQAQGYTPLPAFAVIDECKFFDSKTRQQVDLNPARLAKMADAQNARVAATGDATPVILGHTEDNKPEGEQPPIVGYATRFRVDRLPNGKAAIFARPWAAPGQVETFRKNPRRSVELWLSPDAIDPIALLGPTTPRRDLGLHLFARQYDAGTDTTSKSVVRFSRSTEPGRQPVLFEMREDMDPVKCDQDAGAAPPPPVGDAPAPPVDQDSKQLKADVAKCLAFIDKFGPILEQVLEEEQGAGPDGGPPPEAPGSAPPGAPPPGAAPGGPPVPDRGDGPDKKNMAAAPGVGGSAPGYGNTNMPTHFGLDPETRIRMQRLEDQNRARDAQLAEARGEVAVLRLQRMEDDTRALLADLDREGVTVDADYDFPRLVRMAKDDRAREADAMRRLRVKKSPALPGNGRPVVGTEDIQSPQAIRFAHDGTGVSLPGDPALKSAIPDDYDALVGMVRAGTPVTQLLAPPTPPAAPAAKVR